MDTASTLSQVVSSLNPHSRDCFWTIPLTHHLCLAGMQQPNLGTGNATACSVAEDAQLSGKNWSSGERCKKVLSGVTPLLYYCCAERERGREGGREGERKERERTWMSGISVHKDHCCFLQAPRLLLTRGLSLNQLSPGWFPMSSEESLLQLFLVLKQR